MDKKSNFEDIGFYESVMVIIPRFSAIFGEPIAFEMDNDYESGDMLKFGEILKESRKRGYQGGTILLILESFLNGKIYRYGNYRDDMWYEVGKMEGFA